MNATLTLPELKNEVQRMDPALMRKDSVFKTALLMLASVHLGTHDVRELSRFTKLSQGFIRPRAQRLVDNAVWVDGGKTACDWFGEDGGIAFWMDVCVADGLMRRAPSDLDDEAQNTTTSTD